jgi:F-type H+-transporting ATPase subunit gamma
MPSLKEYRNRIASVKSTRKITSAMKMVAASKLRRAQEQAEAGQPFAERMASMLSRLAESTASNAGGPKLLVGTGSEQSHLIIVMTSDRGLCGAFNANVVREARRQVNALLAQGKSVKLICVGRKGYDLLRRQFDKQIAGFVDGLGRGRIQFADADKIAGQALALFNGGEVDIVSVVYNRFRSVISQVPTQQQLIPFSLPKAAGASVAPAGAQALYEFEPSEEAILEALLPRNLAVQIYRALLDSAAGEQAARMTAMDNATRNAGDMISKLTLNYNRARQAYITKELIEIISGAEAV